jgi:hypothetical protein
MLLDQKVHLMEREHERFREVIFKIAFLHPRYGLFHGHSIANSAKVSKLSIGKEKASPAAGFSHLRDQRFNLERELRIFLLAGYKIRQVAHRVQVRAAQIIPSRNNQLQDIPSTPAQSSMSMPGSDETQPEEKRYLKQPPFVSKLRFTCGQHKRSS